MCFLPTAAGYRETDFDLTFNNQHRQQLWLLEFSSDTYRDAPFSVDEASLERAIECPQPEGISGAPRGIILLLSGTTLSGGDEWPGPELLAQYPEIVSAPVVNGIHDPSRLCMAWGMSDYFTSFQMGTGNGLVMPPEISHLDGAANFAVQQNDICGSGNTADHIQIVVDPAVYALTVNALNNGGQASAARFDTKKSCHGFANTTYSQSYFNATVNRVNNVINQPTTSTTYQASNYSLTSIELPLKAYVCKQGQATTCGSLFDLQLAAVACKYSSGALGNGTAVEHVDRRAPLNFASFSLFGSIVLKSSFSLSALLGLITSRSYRSASNLVEASVKLRKHISSRGVSTDAPFSVDTADLKKAIECPRGISGVAGGIVLLVSGTTLSGGDEWPGTPFYEYLPYEGPGYDVCWLNNPSKGLGDAQVSSEYIAYNIPLLASKSATGRIAIVGHSQGAGLTPQWALDFWPSTRARVSAYIAISGMFHGTLGTYLPIIITAVNVACPVARCQAEGQNGCYPSFYQMSNGSAYIDAQVRRGGRALVPTTSLWSRVDGTVIPEDVDPTSYLKGAANFAVQQDNICGSGDTSDHVHMVIDPAVYALAVDALAHSGHASATRFNKTSCHVFSNSTYNQAYFNATVGRINNIIVNASALTAYQATGYNLTAAEPPLKVHMSSHFSVP
ncbi:alpha/beta-hydrolase [Athelia psychrophila]|uniref:Alpha/beta-hydrolase n=1 Tax=Athelia psychrophila TaxID=1759441 RepID=A0A166UWR0_9AGAM|nr:alpha/beta-hydrolase [Fibularhizoctonia sp. CBS 109695]